jgi:hypothetical protein
MIAELPSFTARRNGITSAGCGSVICSFATSAHRFAHGIDV